MICKIENRVKPSYVIQPKLMYLTISGKLYMLIINNTPNAIGDCVKKVYRNQKKPQKYFFKIISNFRPLKVNYRLFLRLILLHHFFLTLITISFYFIYFYYIIVLCFYFHFLFLTLLATKHFLQFTMFHIISLQTAHNIREIINASWATKKEKVLLL